MTDSLDVITNKLMLREDDVLATVNPRIANVVHRGLKLHQSGASLLARTGLPLERDLTTVQQTLWDRFGHVEKDARTKLVDDMLYGVCGTLGYVHMVMRQNQPSLVGIVHIPRKVMGIVLATSDEVGVEAFLNEFASEQNGSKWANQRWDLVGCRTELADITRTQLPFLEQTYNWMLVRTAEDVMYGEDSVGQKIINYQGSVRKYMMRLDNYIFALSGHSGSSITPEIAFENYRRKQQAFLPSADK